VIITYLSTGWLVPWLGLGCILPEDNGSVIQQKFCRYKSSNALPMRWRKIYPLEMPDIFQNVREILDIFLRATFL